LLSKNHFKTLLNAQNKRKTHNKQKHSTREPGALRLLQPSCLAEKSSLISLDD